MVSAYGCCTGAHLDVSRFNIIILILQSTLLISMILTHDTTVFSIFQARGLGITQDIRHLLLLSQPATCHCQSRAFSVPYLLGNSWNSPVGSAASCPSVFVILYFIQDISPLPSTSLIFSFLYFTIPFPWTNFPLLFYLQKFYALTFRTYVLWKAIFFTSSNFLGQTSPLLVLSGSHCITIFPTPHTAIRAILPQNTSGSPHNVRDKKHTLYLFSTKSPAWPG